MVTKGWGVITGAGPGIMEAGTRGAGKEHSFGVNIRLPVRGCGNRYLDESRTVNFKYFFTRKLAFVKESHAFAILPGGWGTLDEAFELLTLIQTGKSDLHPIVLLESPDTGYWEPMIDFIQERPAETWADLRARSRPFPPHHRPDRGLRAHLALLRQLSLAALRRGQADPAPGRGARTTPNWRS